MKRKSKGPKWQIIYEGSGSVTGNSWFEEVAYLGNERWLLRLYDDPAWSLEPEEPMESERKTSRGLVDWVLSIDSAGTEDAFEKPRQKALYDIAISAGAERCVELLKEEL